MFREHGEHCRDRLPTARQLARQIQDAWDEGKELILTVLKSMNQEQVNAMKEAPKAD